MRTGRPASLTDIADHFALTDARTLFHSSRKCAHVRIEGRISALMADHHYVAIAALASNKVDHPVRRGADARAAGGTVVDAGMLPPGIVNWVHAPAKTGRHTRKLERGAQKRLAQIFPLG